jgi:endonuclease YncB( thermonuclease family)
MQFFRNRDWRIVTASRMEIVVCVVLVGMIVIAGYAESIGGWRKMINIAVRSPKIAAEEYARAGNKICRMEGEFRWSDGNKEDVDWLVVGTTGRHLMYWDGFRIIRNPDHGKFLTCRLAESKAEWLTVRVDGFCEVQRPSFFFDGQIWIYASPGGTAFGTVKSVDGSEPMIRTIDPVAKIFPPAPASMPADLDKTPGTLMARYVDNYDGDTITVDLLEVQELPAIFWDDIKIRVAGIDTPEIRGTSGDVQDMALKAKTMVADLCSNCSRIEIRNPGRGKYFWIVGDVYCDGVNVAAKLLDEGLATPY